MLQFDTPATLEGHSARWDLQLEPSASWDVCIQLTVGRRCADLAPIPL
jgi:hypothetical protein